ncbi:hypothetical protein MMC30_007050 [Trapelia coarctata]|nr:hypothetical protein [Trapelia coarctata]
MASISRLTGSWATAYNENTLALANFNFDFSLYKVEAPQEYRDVETSLSSLRRQKAEDGVLHQTARRLGALFEDTMPPIPKLINAYGQRASEISCKLEAMSKASKTYGLFSGHIGIDASSIWAGATSGPSAIAIHLLACILARTWTGSEATSIWAEIVTERQKEVEKNCQVGVALPIATLLAARQDIARSQLAEWDASARAWLRSADEVKCFEQKQLTLILSNVEIAVNNKTHTYSNVLAAWKGAMAAMENLLSGVALRVQDGAVLLGFAAWHIFPDIVVLGQTLQEVHLKDALVSKGAILELGLQSSDSQKSQGVFWSLSLAHLRYYGTPVSVSRSLTYDDSRVSIDQLYLIALGSVISNWITPGVGRKLEEPLRWFKTLDEIMGPGVNIPEVQWFSKLVRAACTVLDSQGLEAKYSSLLLSYGRNQGKRFIGPISTLFGLGRYSTLLRLTESKEARITILLSAARKLGLRDNDCIIRYCSSEGNSFVYASELPTSLGQLFEKPEPRLVPDFCRYIVRDTAILKLKKTDSRNLSPTTKKRRRSRYDSAEIQHRANSNREYLMVLGDPHTEGLLVQSEALAGYLASWNSDPTNLGNSVAESIMVGGKLYASDYPILLDALAGIELDSNDLGGFLPSLHPDALRKYFRDLCLEMVSLRALDTAASLYESFPGATVPLGMSRWPLSESLWIPKLPEGKWTGSSQLSGIYRLSRAAKFSCLALFESGSCDLRQDQLENVMAMSVGNGLYISDCLLRDPVRHNDHCGIRRAVGNIGRPGISLLYSPLDVQIRSQKLDSWMLMDLKPFKGEKLDSFPSTSMHLSFTGYEVPASINPEGEQDVETTLIETAVSVLDCGKWVADIDIQCRYGQKLNPSDCAFSRANRLFPKYFSLPQHKDPMERPTKCDHGDTMPAEFPFLRIDNWDELLSDLEGPAIVATHKNLFARLAVAAVCMQKYRSTYVLPEDACMKCLVEFFGEEFAIGKLWQGDTPCVVIM